MHYAGCFDSLNSERGKKVLLPPYFEIKTETQKLSNAQKSYLGLKRVKGKEKIKIASRFASLGQVTKRK